MRRKEENEYADKIKHQKLFMKLLLLSFILFLFPDSCNIYLAYFIFQLLQQDRSRKELDKRTAAEECYYCPMNAFN